MGKSVLSTAKGCELPDLVGAEKSSCQKAPHLSLSALQQIHPRCNSKVKFTAWRVLNQQKEAKRGTRLLDVGQRLILFWGSVWRVNTWSKSYFSCFNMTIK